MNMDNYNVKLKSAHLKSITEVVSNIVINICENSFKNKIWKLLFRAFGMI